MTSLFSSAEVLSSSVPIAVALIALLVFKELASAMPAESRWRALGRYLNVAIAPLLMVFAVAILSILGKLILH